MHFAHAVLSSLVLIASADAAETLPPAPMLAKDIRCEAKPGKDAQVSFAAPGKAFTVTGKIHVVASRGNADYVPSVFILLIGKNGAEVGLKSFIEPKEPDQLQLGIQLAVDESTKIGSWPWRISPANFIVAITVEGQLKVDAVGLVAAAPLENFEVERIVISCSAGKFEFQNFSAQAW